MKTTTKKTKKEKGVTEINLTIKVTDQNIDDIMVCAMEGGINYWCEKAEVKNYLKCDYASDVISKGGKMTLHCIEDYDKPILTKEKFIKGLEMFLKERPDAISNGEVDCGAIDADYADMIIQYAVFDELVFG